MKTNAPKTTVHSTRPFAQPRSARIQTKGPSANEGIIPPPFLTPTGETWGRPKKRYDPLLALCYNLIERDFIDPFLKKSYLENSIKHGDKYNLPRRIRNTYIVVKRALNIRLSMNKSQIPYDKKKHEDDIHHIAMHMCFLAAYLSSQEKTAQWASDVISTLQQGLQHAIFGGAPQLRDNGPKGMRMQAFWVLLGHAASCATIATGPLVHMGLAAHVGVGLGSGALQGAIGIAKKHKPATLKDLGHAGGEVAVSTLAASIPAGVLGDTATQNATSLAIEQLGTNGRDLIEGLDVKK